VVNGIGTGDVIRSFDGGEQERESHATNNGA
jgi:hypothetical protein